MSVADASHGAMAAARAAGTVRLLSRFGKRRFSPLDDGENDEADNDHEDQAHKESACIFKYPIPHEELLSRITGSVWLLPDRALPA